MSPNLENVMFRVFLFGVSAGSVLAPLPLVVRDILRGGPLIYGIMFGAFGVGGIAGAILTALVGERVRSEQVVGAICTGFAQSAVVHGLGPDIVITLLR